jgi:hypothetical protein
VVDFRSTNSAIARNVVTCELPRRRDLPSLLGFNLLRDGVGDA